LSDAAAVAATQPTHIERDRLTVARRENAGLTAADLYALYCTACHGANGDGNGRAARHQFPRPRDLRAEGFRLVSTRNGNPTREDLEKTIKRGMPGTAMRAFDHLSENQRQLLAAEVLRIHREGVRDGYVALLRAEEEQIDEQHVQAVVNLRSLPGDSVRVPAIGPADPPAVTRGREVYFQSGCRSCHGDHGTGASDVALFDQQGLPVLPRDLVSGPFKGGREPESVFLRILAGMPGSPHPATGLTDERAVDLVHYCGALARQPQRTLTNHQRFLDATRDAPGHR
jgi:mono/diheme cytochrome c family protein